MGEREKLNEFSSDQRKSNPRKKVEEGGEWERGLGYRSDAGEITIGIEELPDC